MFQPNYPKAALGLEKEFITALALQKEGRGRFGIKQAATLELPVGLLNPSFTEKNISNQREMLTLLRGHEVERYQLSNSIAADVLSVQQIVVSAWPSRLEPSAKARLVLNAEPEIPGCTLIDRQADVSLVHCP